MKTLGIIVLLVVVVGAIVLLAKPQSAVEPVQDDTAGQSIDMSTEEKGGIDPLYQDMTNEDIQQAVANVKTFTVNGNNFSFAPSTMTVNKGDTVKIIFKNTGGTHDLVIDEFNAATPKISGGQEATIQFVADKSGTFEYYCSIGSHRQMGMKGTLTVK